MATVDVERLAAILREAAKREILPRFRHLAPDQVRRKTEAIDLVTEADEEAERFIGAEVAGLWPRALFVGEEAVAASPALLPALASADLAIVVDPVDGTANFAAGLPLFAVMAAVVSGGETVAGIVYDPMGDDWMLAEKGGGAWRVRADGERIRLAFAEPKRLEQMVGYASVAFLPQELRPEVLANLAKARLFANYRCAGHEYRTLVSGFADFALYSKLMPWDHLAGTLMVQEAGGYVARLDGEPYRPHHVDGGLIVAADRSAWEVLRREVYTL